MDYARYLRAIDAQYVEYIEEKRKEYLKPNADPKEQTPEIWEAIREHDRLLGGSGGHKPDSE